MEYITFTVYLLHVAVNVIFIMIITKTPQSGLKDQISEKLWSKLPEGQQQLLLANEKKRCSVMANSLATLIVKDITKMQLPQTNSVGQFLLLSL